MKTKKWLKTFVIFGSFSCISLHVNAFPTPGIAVYDANNDLHQAQTFAQIGTTIKTIADGNTTFSNTMRGFTDLYGSNFGQSNNGFMKFDNWKDILSALNIDELGRDLGFSSEEMEDPVVRQTVYDYGLQQKTYDATVKNSQEIEQLQSQMSSANTIAKKSDVTNALLLKQIQLQNNMMMQASMEKTMQEQQQADLTKKNKAWIKNALQ